MREDGVVLKHPCTRVNVVRLGPDTSLIIAEQESTMGRASHPTENLKQGRLSHTRGSGDSNELPRTKDPRHTAEQERTGV